MDPLFLLKEELAAGVSRALSAQGIQVPTDAVEITDTTKKAFGDLSTPVAIRAASSLGLKPAEVAEATGASLPRVKMVQRVEAKGGYLNFFIDWEQFTPALVDDILTRGKEYGRPDASPGTLILEHTSVNPTGPLNIARSRNSIIGDSLSRIFAYMGWRVVRHYLLNDIGHQIVVIHWGLKNGISSPELAKRYSSYAEKEDFRVFFTYVPAAAREKEDPEAGAQVAELESRTHTDPDLLRELQSQSQACLKGQLETLSKLDIGFDEIKPDSHFIGETTGLIQRLRSKGMIVDEEDGSIGLDLSSVGLVRRKTQHITLVKSDGSSTYTLRDIAYHEWKFRSGDLFITVLGEDHKREFAELKAILEMLGHDKDLQAAFYSFVTYEGGKKMSTRKGATVPLDEMIEDARGRAREEVEKRREDLPEENVDRIADQVGLGAIKFNILKVDPSKAIRFRWEEAINFSGDSSAYVQYAHARASSILKNSDADGSGRVKSLVEPEERELIWALARAPGVIGRAAKDMKPNYVAEHALEIATLFNRFYMQHRVLQADEPLRSARLSLVECTKILLSLELGLLGVTAPDEI